MNDEQLKELREKIIAQANEQGQDGWMDMVVPSSIQKNGLLKIPRGAFEKWAVWRSGGDHLTVPWNVVSPRGLKQGGDDPYHTDWMLGAGFELQDMRASGSNPNWQELSSAAYTAKAEVENRLLGFQCSILLSGPSVTGRVYVPKTSKLDHNKDNVPSYDEDGLPPILVIRDASPEWLEHASEVLKLGGAVIVERGGEMTHLITVLREENVGPIVRMPNARKLYPQGALVSVSPGNGSIELKEDERLISEFAAERILSSVVMSEDKIIPSQLKNTFVDLQPKYDIIFTEKEKGINHPADDMEYFLIIRKLESYNYTVYCSALCDSLRSSKGGNSAFDAQLLWIDVPKDDIAILKMYIVSREDRKSRTLYTDLRKWESKEAIRQACLEALYVVDPGARFAADRYFQELQKKEAEAVAALKILDDDILIEKVCLEGEEEYSLIEGFESGFYDLDDLTYLRRQHEAAFFRFDNEFQRRGLLLKADDFRPMLNEELPNAYFPDKFPPKDSLDMKI